MSLTIQQIIVDAKRLSGRLKERDTATDRLLTQTHAISKKIDAMKQYQEDVEYLNEVAQHKPHSQIIATIQKENRHLREIQQENRELRLALEEHQTAIDHIMTKYRQHTSEQIFKSCVNFECLQNQNYEETIRMQAEKIKEMATVMEHAAFIDETRDNRDEEIMTRLKHENEGLRELLAISCKFGSYGALNGPSTESKTIQTDNVST